MLALLVEDAAAYVARMAARRHRARAQGEQAAAAEPSRAAPQGAAPAPPQPALPCVAAPSAEARRPEAATPAAAPSAEEVPPAVQGAHAGGDAGLCACAALHEGAGARGACPPALPDGRALGRPSEGAGAGLGALFLDCFDGRGEVPAQLLQQRFLADCAAALAPGVRRAHGSWFKERVWVLALQKPLSWRTAPLPWRPGVRRLMASQGALWQPGVLYSTHALSRSTHMP